MMKALLPFLLITVFCFCILQLNAQTQDKPVHPVKISHGVFLGETPPLRDLPALSQAQVDELTRKRSEEKEMNEGLSHRSYPFSDIALPKGPDQAWQRGMGSKSALANTPIQNFAGQTSSSFPPDCNGAVGPNHYMQAVNVTYAIYNKTGTKLAGPTAFNTLFGSVPGATRNDGDPLVLYDEQADRWLAVEFSVPSMVAGSGNDYMLIAVSTTNDPTGTWNKYSFDVADGPDYEKFGIWQDGYYMGVNNSAGNDIYVFQRSVMVAGGASPGMIGFTNPNRPTSIDGFMCVPPVDNDGAFAPAGAPGTFIAFNDDAIGGGADQLWIYELHADWTTPASSTFSRVQQIPVTAFDSNFGTGWNNIAQLGTTMKVDAIPQVIMNPPQYRNFGTYQTIVCCHTVDVDGTDHAGIRWYELRRGTQTSGNWTVRQTGTYAPDANSRWMGSIMLNGTGKIGLGYSVSSSTINPGIRYTGQSASAYAAGLGVMDISEQTIQSGSYSQTGYNRWGDYSDLSIDPTDDQTFWYTTEYMASTSSHATKIASFKFGNDPTVATIAASAITATTATLNGTVNPNGLATTYYFQYGLTTSYGSTTTSTSAGSGSTAVAVSAALTGLTAGATYHYRIAGTNTDGTNYGVDMSFTALGAATVTTTAASSITQTTATSGGTVTSDGGYSITARGVCWSTSASPTISGSHTSDGTGTGVFTSSLTGLLPVTLYHIRAYATNANGTYYGSDLTFTTDGAAVVTTTAASAITNTTATSGGTVSSDGGSTVSARGVCWSTAASPTIAGSHTTDGSGTGTFTSSITGLSASTIYHIRAYATNANGTFYGTDLTFTTTCGIITAYPWTETFENAGAIPNCWTQEYVTTGNLSWTFVTGNG
ncbi:MAG: hypothetical protein HXX13_18565, partial [Bacteroidetes bacterium]|nr:hypothetical protein [Bacteroidota bacterium]